MRPRQFAFAVIGAILGAILGWVGAAALHQSRIGGIVVVGVVGIAAGIGVGRYLGQRARLKEAGAALPKLDEHGDPVGGDGAR